MIEYIFIFAVVLLCIFTKKRMAADTQKFAVAFICIYVIILMGIRYRVGIDTLNYMSSYMRVPSWNEFLKLDFTETRFEPGYMLVCVICRNITPDFWLLQLVMASITNIGIFIFIYRYSSNTFVGILVYFIIAWLYFTTEIMRESAAVAIFLLNYENLKNKRWLKFYLYSLLSISFHYSAMIIWIFPFVTYIKKINIWYIIIIFGLLMIMPFAKSLNQLITVASITSRIEEHIASAETLNLNWRLGELIKAALTPCVGLYIAYKANLKLSFKPYVLLHLLFCAGAFSIPIIFSRFTNYTTIFACVFIANLLSEHKITILKRNLFFCILLLSQSNYYHKMYQSWIPYVSIFDGTKVGEREKLWWRFNH